MVWHYILVEYEYGTNYGVLVVCAWEHLACLQFVAARNQMILCAFGQVRANNF